MEGGTTRWWRCVHFVPHFSGSHQWVVSQWCNLGNNITQLNFGRPNVSFNPLTGEILQQYYLSVKPITTYTCPKSTGW